MIGIRGVVSDCRRCRTAQATVFCQLEGNRWATQVVAGRRRRKNGVILACAEFRKSLILDAVDIRQENLHERCSQLQRRRVRSPVRQSCRGPGIRGHHGRLGATQRATEQPPSPISASPNPSPPASSRWRPSPKTTAESTILICESRSARPALTKLAPAMRDTKDTSESLRILRRGDVLIQGGWGA